MRYLAGFRWGFNKERCKEDNPSDAIFYFIKCDDEVKANSVPVLKG
jgi:hypothetical protein